MNAWWIGLWDLHMLGSRDVGSIAFYFLKNQTVYCNDFNLPSMVGINSETVG
jgi:hypothetical protein